MTQNGLKHILNMFLKSVTKTDLDPPPNVKNVTLFFFFLMKASLNKKNAKLKFILQVHLIIDFYNIRYGSIYVVDLWLTRVVVPKLVSL